MWIPVLTVHKIQIQSATKHIEKLDFVRLIKNSQSLPQLGTGGVLAWMPELG